MVKNLVYTLAIMLLLIGTSYAVDLEVDVDTNNAMDIVYGGTNSTTPTAARTALGVVIGTNVQAYDADLTTWAGITPAANVQSLLSAADYAAFTALIGTDDMVTLSGVALGEVDLSEFTGSTIADDQTIKAALQALETTVELKADKATFPVSFCFAISDETTDLTVGAAKYTFRAPYAFTLTEIRISVNTAPTDATIEVDINESGTTVLSTVLTIDSTETTSTTATTTAVISDSAIADDAEIKIDIDQVGSSTAGKGLKICLIGTRAL